LKPNRKFVFVILIVALPLIITILSREMWLDKIGEFLVHKDPIKPADAIIVLSGSGNGSRIRAGAHLFKEGFGKAIVVSGEESYPGFYTHILMKSYAIKQGVPKDKIIARRITGEKSTWGEGITNLKTIQESGFKSFILVTSAFHTRRAYHIYKELISEKGYNLQMLVYPAEDLRVPIRGWWKSRVGRKHILLEYLSTINYMLEH